VENVKIGNSGEWKEQYFVRQLQPDVISRVKDGRVEIARVLHDAMDFPHHAEGLFRES
jgi:plasmid stabilization system protein ParE